MGFSWGLLCIQSVNFTGWHGFLDQMNGYQFIQGDLKVSVQLTITVQSSGAQSLFDHPV